MDTKFEWLLSSVTCIRMKVRLCRRLFLRWMGDYKSEAKWKDLLDPDVDRFCVYSLINNDGDGELLSMYQTSGDRGLAMVLNTYAEQYMYGGGKGKVLKKDEYYRWLISQDKVQGNKPKDIDVLVKEYRPDPGTLFEEHEVCWSLNARGACGETALHLCLLNHNPLHAEIAKVMLGMYPKLAMDIYEGEEYYGESALHICIVYGDLDSAKLLVEKGANIHQRATGKFFLPEDQKKKRTRGTNYEGYAYYGEYPLSFSACFGEESIYDYLISQGANPNAQDSFGNTVLHMVVITNQLDMYSYAARHPLGPANTWIKNNEGLTPLALASKLGRHKIFNEIMELHRIELWRFSNINCSYYPLHAIDTIGPGGETNWNSALMITVNGETDEHLEMMQGGVIKQLLDEKWRTFVRARFIQRLVMAVAHLFFLSIAVYLRPKKDLLFYHSYVDGIRFVCETIVIGSCFSTLMMHVGEIKTLGFLLFIKALKNAPSKAIFLISCMLLLLCVPIRLTQFTDLYNEGYVLQLQLIEETLLILALPASWTFLLFFAKVHSTTGQAVMMFYRIVQTDMITFAVIYLIFIVASAQGFYFLFKDISKKTITRFQTPLGSLMSLFHMTLGEFDYEEFSEIHYPSLAKIIFGIFMILMPILLLNMLIAMMGNTYQNVTQKSEKEWVRQWAKIVVVLERGYSKDKLLKFQKKYSDKVDKLPKADAQYLDDEGMAIEYRALMVIKQTSKTKAKQRKGAISNWRWMTKEAMVLIKEVKASPNYHGGEVTFRDLFPDENDLMESERTQRRRNSLRMINNRRTNMALDNPSLKSAIEQLAWERNLLKINKDDFFSSPASETIPEEPVAVVEQNSATVVSDEEFSHLEEEIGGMGMAGPPASQPRAEPVAERRNVADGNIAGNSRTNGRVGEATSSRRLNGVSDESPKINAFGQGLKSLKKS